MRTAFCRLIDELIPIMKQKVLRERFEAGTECVRTYHAVRDTVKDHRIPGKTYKYSDLIKGDGLEKLLEDLQWHMLSETDSTST